MAGSGGGSSLSGRGSVTEGAEQHVMPRIVPAGVGRESPARVARIGSRASVARVSTSISSAVPTLPCTTDALRFSPRSFARLIGEPLNAALNSSCDIGSSSRASVRASLPPSTSRVANAGSFSS